MEEKPEVLEKELIERAAQMTTIPNLVLLDALIKERNFYALRGTDDGVMLVNKKIRKLLAV